MKVAYYTPYYSGECMPRHARMHDIFHYINRQKNPPFQYRIYARKGHSIESSRVRSYDRHICKSRPLDSTGVIDSLCHYLASRWALREIAKDDHDVLHVTILSRTSVALLRQAKQGRSPVKTVVGPNIMALISNRQQDKIDILCSDLVDIIVSVGHYHREVLIESGVSPDKIVPLTPTVDPYYFFSKNNTTPDKFTILYAGNLSDFKGYDTFLAAIRKLYENKIKFSAIVSGHGETRINSDDPLNEHIEFVGYTPRCKMSDLYNASSVYVHPGTDEFGPTTILEATACNVHCVLSDLPSFREYDNDNNFDYFEVGNSDALANILMRLSRSYGDDGLKKLNVQNHEDSIKFLGQLYSSLDAGQ